MMVRDHFFRNLPAGMLFLSFCGIAGAAGLPDRIMEFDYSHNHPVEHPVLRKEAERMAPAEALKKRCADFLALSEAELIAMLPKNGGIFFCGCPAPKCGNRGERFRWDIRRPNELHCLACGADLTVERYPETGTVSATTPEGRKVTYCYHRRSKDGRPCWITAGIDYRKYREFGIKAYEMGALYLKTGDRQYARRAAILIAGLAQAYYNSPYKIEPWLRSPYPEVHFYDGVPEDREMADYQRARPTSWAYQDIPDRVMLAYDFIGGSGELEKRAAELGMEVERDIVKGYFMATVESTLKKKEPYGNMSPYHWTGMLIAGLVLGVPEYVHLAVLRVEEFVRRGFFFDGAWYEVSSGYHAQCVNSLAIFKRVVDGYSDPEGYRASYDGSHYRDFKLFADTPGMLRAEALVGEYLLYPNGIAVPHNDTVPNTNWRQGPPGKITPSNFVSSWRHAALKGTPSEQQPQLRITAAPVATHRHQDMFNITLWALGRELLGDIGYTHTRYRPYASSLPHHNTVTVDFLPHNWWGGSTLRPDTVNRMATGGLPAAADLDRTAFQFASFRGPDLYRHVKDQKRTVMLVEIAPDRVYAADFFDLAQGGGTYDYFLHGDCDADNLAPLEENFAPAELLPAGLRGKLPEPTRETDKNSRKPGYGYQGFRRTMKHAHPADVFVGHYRYAAPDAALTVHLSASGGTRSICAGESPSIRRARENSAKVDKFYRRFYLQRVEKPTGPVRFAAVMEPHPPEKALIRKVSQPAPGVLKVELEKRTDYLFCDLKTPVTADGIVLQGEYGFLSLDETGKVRDYYLSGASLKAPGLEKQAPPAVTLTAESIPGPDSIKVRDLAALPEHYSRTAVLELPGEKSAWNFGIAGIDRAAGIVRFDRPHGLKLQKDGKILRTGYQSRVSPGPMLLKVTAPERFTATGQ